MTAGGDSDETLIRQSANGDAEAFEQLVYRYEGRLLRFLQQRTSNRHEAEDLLQDTFLRAWKGIHRCDPCRQLGPWLFAIARNATISNWRKAQRAPELAEHDVADERRPYDEALRREQGVDLWGLARRVLPERQHTALWLAYVEDLAAKEIAGAMRTTVGNVKVLLHRGRRRLARELQPRIGGSIQ